MSGEWSEAHSFSTSSKVKAVEFCRDLVLRGLTRQKAFKPQSRVPENCFRTSFRPATKCLGQRYVVKFRDETPGARVSRPARDAGPKCKRPAGPCSNAEKGCTRARVYHDGFCKNCHDRHEYATNPTLRARKLRQALERQQRRRAAKVSAAEETER